MENCNILKELGSGCFGRVYLVEHKKTKQQYAMKVIDACFVGFDNQLKHEHFKKCIAKEIEGLKLFSTYNIGPKLYDFWIIYPKAYIMMEKMDMTLETYLSSVENKNEHFKTLFHDVITIKEKYKLHHKDAQIHNIMVNLDEEKRVKEIKFIDCAYSIIETDHDDKYFRREQDSLKILLDAI